MSDAKVSQNEDRELVLAAKADPQAFGKLYEKYHEQIRLFIRARLHGDQDTVLDLTATVFEKSLQNIGQYEERSLPFSAWLYRIAKNLIIDHFRKSSNRLNIPVGDNLDLFGIDETQVDAEVEKKLLSQSLQKIIAELPEREQQIIKMKFFLGYTNRVIATELQMTETNVGTIIYRTLQRLKENIS